MTYDGTMNTRIIDSVTTNAALLTGQAPSQAFGILDTVMAETLGMSMHNAVMRQQSDSMVSTAAVTAACAKMLQTPYPIEPPPPIPIGPFPPQVQIIEPAPGSPPPDPSEELILAIAEGEAALQALKDQAAQAAAQATAAQSAVATAEAELAALAQQVAPPSPPSPPSPPAPPSPPGPTGVARGRRT